MAYKEFDFEKSNYGDLRKRWLKKNCHALVSEEEFVEAWRSFGGPYHSPSICKKNYRNLQETFGFFV